VCVCVCVWVGGCGCVWDTFYQNHCPEGENTTGFVFVFDGYPMKKVSFGSEVFSC
jgi:hypothetical protein